MIDGYIKVRWDLWCEGDVVRCRVGLASVIARPAKISRADQAQAPPVATVPGQATAARPDRGRGAFTSASRRGRAEGP